MKRILLIFIGLVVLVWVFFEFFFPNRNDFTRVVYKADHARLLAECRALIAATELMPRDKSISDDPRIRSFDKTDPLLFRREFREIASLNPKYVSVSDKELMICLSALPRVYIFAFRTNVQEYGTERITNGLWFSYDPDRDVEEAIRHANKE